ncbi:hypothetical protein VKT23_018839 [Stygiomarasmius scandens]|uniref:C2H2-type domain-containing protein n=1 Tax=Marasmiellus scandens TaxID=2682957 RepID=A0ABR1ISD9_9AGAR
MSSSRSMKVDKIKTSDDIRHLDHSSPRAQYSPYYNHYNQRNAYPNQQSLQGQSPTPSVMSPIDPSWQWNYSATSPQSPYTSSTSSGSLWTPLDHPDSNTFMFPPLHNGGTVSGSTYYREEFNRGAGGADNVDYVSPLSPQPSYLNPSSTAAYSYKNQVTYSTDQSAILPQHSDITAVSLGSGGTKKQVATDALVKASHSRRKDQKNPGQYVCELCGRDFTANHNLNSMSFSLLPE